MRLCFYWLFCCIWVQVSKRHYHFLSGLENISWCFIIKFHVYKKKRSKCIIYYSMIFQVMLILKQCRFSYPYSFLISHLLKASYIITYDAESSTVLLVWTLASNLNVILNYVNDNPKCNSSQGYARKNVKDASFSWSCFN